MIRQQAPPGPRHPYRVTAHAASQEACWRGEHDRQGMLRIIRTAALRLQARGTEVSLGTLSTVTGLPEHVIGRYWP